MPDYQDAAHEAYRRLLWAQQNRPDAATVEKIKREQALEARDKRVRRFRKSVA